MLRLIAIACLLLLSACSSAPPPVERVAEDIPASRPPDFTLAMTVYAPAGTRPGQLPRSLKPARYIVEPDGALRADARTKSVPYPPMSRRLAPEQMDQLWRMLRESALLDPANPARVDDPAGVAPADRSLATVYISYFSTRRTLRIPLDRSSETALAGERLADRLAEWAWIE
jgi:hypothetical protein